MYHAAGLIATLFYASVAAGLLPAATIESKIFGVFWIIHG
jgi:hypothetical protein